MAKYTIEDTTLTAVADKLREKTGTAEEITPEEMPGMVAALSSPADALMRASIYVANFLKDDVLVEHGIMNEYDGTIVS